MEAVVRMRWWFGQLLNEAECLLGFAHGKVGMEQIPAKIYKAVR